MSSTAIQACPTAKQQVNLNILVRIIDRDRLRYELMDDDSYDQLDRGISWEKIDALYLECREYLSMDEDTKAICDKLIEMGVLENEEGSTESAVGVLSELKGHLMAGLIRSQVKIVEAFDRQSTYCRNMSQHVDLESISPSQYVHGARDVRKECQHTLESVISDVKTKGFSEVRIAEAFGQLDALKKLGSRADYKVAAEMSSRLQRALMDRCKTPCMGMEDLLDDDCFSGVDPTSMMNTMTMMYIEELSQRLGFLREHSGMVDRTYGNDFNADLHPYVKSLHETLLSIRETDMPDVERLRSILMDFAEQDIDLAWQYSMMFLAALEAKNCGAPDAVTFRDVDDDNIYTVLGERKFMTIARTDLFAVKREGLSHFNVSDARIAELDRDVYVLVTEYFWCDKEPMATEVKNGKLIAAEGCFVVDIYNCKDAPAILHYALGMPYEHQRRAVLESAVISYAHGGGGLEGRNLQMYACMPRLFLPTNMETSDPGDRFLWRRPLKPDGENYASSEGGNMHEKLLGKVYADPHTALISRDVFMRKAPHLRYG